MPVLIGAALSLERATFGCFGCCLRGGCRDRRRCGGCRRQCRAGLNDSVGFRCGLANGRCDRIRRSCLGADVHGRNRNGGIGGRCAWCRDDRRRFRRHGCECRCCRSGLCRIPGTLRCRCNRLRGLDGRCTGRNRRRGNCERLGRRRCRRNDRVRRCDGRRNRHGNRSRRYNCRCGGLRRRGRIGSRGVRCGDDVGSRVLDRCFHDARLCNSGLCRLAGCVDAAIAGIGLTGARLRVLRRGVRGRARRAAPSRGWRLSDAADGSSGRGCGDGRSGAAGRSLPAVSAALLSISAEKLSGAGVWSARADRAGAFGTDRLAAVSDVTLNTGGLSRMIPPSRSARTGPRGCRNKNMIIQLVRRCERKLRGRRHRFVSARRQELPFGPSQKQAA